MEILLGLLGAAVVWLVVEVVVGGIVGELLLRPMQLLLGPPLGKYVVGAMWLVVAVLGYMAWSGAEPDWTHYGAWLGFLLAGVASLLMLVFYVEAKREDGPRGRA